MSVNAISQLHAAQTENTSTHGSHRVQSGGSKANSAQALAHANAAQQAEEAQAAATAQNNAGHEQGGEKNGGQGGHVNLYA
jgi:hypothetical protein